jgi:glycosyltransferase involved in cell wall biosynthesis
MIEHPLVSVVIPTYNAARFLVDAIDSVLAQTYQPLEVLVVDDGSTDDTARVLEPYGGRIRYIRQTNGGPAKARNRGIREAKGELIAFLDADDQWLPEKLSKQWACHRAHPDAALSHTDLYRVLQPAGERTYRHDGRERFAGNCYLEFFRNNGVTPSTVLLTRACLETVGLFDEKIRAASTEDWELWIRIARRYPLAYLNEPLTLYRVHPTSGSQNLLRMVENTYYTLAKSLQADPALWETLGRKQFRRRLHELAFGAGYGNADAREMSRARYYFGAALAFDPLRLKAWAFWASTFLPAGLRHQLRGWKQRLESQGTPRHDGGAAPANAPTRESR